MAEFNAVVAEPSTGRSYKTTVSGRLANSLVGKKIGDEIDGVFVNLPGYKLTITGGSDGSGVPMRADLPGQATRRLLSAHSSGFKLKRKGKNRSQRSTAAGMRRRKLVRGNTISVAISQLNLRVESAGPRGIEETLAGNDNGEK